MEFKWVTYKVHLEIPYFFDKEGIYNHWQDDMSKHQGSEEISLISRVPETLEYESFKDKIGSQNKIGEGVSKEDKDCRKEEVETFNKDGKATIKDGKGCTKSLQWDYELDLNKSKEIIDTGDLDLISGDSQNSLCILLSGIKLKGVCRPKMRNINKNPFEIGKCKLWQRHRKPKSHKVKHIMMDRSLVPKVNLKEKSDIEAYKILDMADLLGLTYRKDKAQMVEDISTRIDNGII